jgi:predicted transcriptional regulator with HTH domain
MGERHDRFWDWLAGFIDGEGYFGLVLDNKCWRAEFTIKLRRDDIEILEEIKIKLGFGRLYEVASYSTDGSNPQAKYTITNARNAARLADILDSHPLRAKKRKDFELWRIGVRELLKPYPDNEYLSELSELMKSERKYKSAPQTVTTLCVREPRQKALFQIPLIEQN